MNTEALAFERPRALEASTPVERRGTGRAGDRDDVQLLVSSADNHARHAFRDLPELLAPGDLLVVNRSATIPASLPAEAGARRFILNLCTRYSSRLWLAELRWSPAEPGPVPLERGERFAAAGVAARVVARHPRLERLTFVSFDAPIEQAMHRHGTPIRYGYVATPQPLEAYQTIFADTPGSAEMPSAGRPFTSRTLAACRRRGIELARITLHTGVSSLDAPAGSLDAIDLYAEPFEVPAETARSINEAQAQGRRVIAVGTTVVRALESAWDGVRVSAVRGFTRRVVRPGNSFGVVDALLTGFHDSGTSHLAMLSAIAGRDTVLEAYRTAVAHGFLWHEFGDVHLLWAQGEDRRLEIRQASARAP